MALVSLQRVTKSYGALPVVDDVSIDIADGEFFTLLGASGSGKTTCLRMVAGFVYPDSGRVMLGGTDATGLPPYRRNTAMVFQNYALFPHLTVADNVAYGLKVRRQSRAEIASRVEEVLRLVHLEALRERYPAQLSGGQKQRVALARAIAIRPSVLLLDEPLSALDLKLRGELQTEIRRVQQALKITTIFVTHDQGEALGMSNRVAVMRDGRILQVGTPVELYQQPTSSYVANFIGTTNIITVVARGRNADGSQAVVLASDPTQGFEVAAPALAIAEGEKCLLCLRPENMRLQGGARNRLALTIARVTYIGERWVADCTLRDGSALTINLPGWGRVPAPGEQVDITWAPEHAVLLKADDTASSKTKPAP